MVLVALYGLCGLGFVGDLLVAFVTFVCIAVMVGCVLSLGVMVGFCLAGFLMFARVLTFCFL